MRIALIVPDGDPNPQYRAILPMDELGRRGHIIGTAVSPQWTEFPPLESFEGFDVVYFWRMFYTQIRQLARRLQEMGIAVIWDNDVNLAAAPSDVTGYRSVGGLKGQRDLVHINAMVRLADAVTTPSETLAELYRKAGQEYVHVIENYVVGTQPPIRRSRREVVIGWVAGSEHSMDLRRMPIEAALTQLLEQRTNAHVISVGLRLNIDHPRYLYRRPVLLSELPKEIGAFDVGIAPLSDTPYNRSRSNIKLKEYAALGVPWVASDATPYAGLGEEHGGWLVEDDEWLDALLQLVDEPLTRTTLSRAAHAWGCTQTVSANAYRWEEILAQAVVRARARRTRAA